MIDETLLKVAKEEHADDVLRTPEELTKEAFLARPPALGLTLEDMNDVRAAASTLEPRFEASVFRQLRLRMLRMMIPCDGASTVTQLADRLNAELVLAGVTAPTGWYHFNKRCYGIRRIGLRACCAHGCLRAESPEDAGKHFLKCVGWTYAQYCSKVCQRRDWKTSHTHVCRNAKEHMQKHDEYTKIMYDSVRKMGFASGDHTCGFKITTSDGSGAPAPVPKRPLCDVLTE
ncbi:hypothetical protein CYMTET_14338 [Cymbomonas tetramitiformis]|uniref:MYND-type domain-containing protein n=1 Tax=Cymbomonas tetramitiformis TaxID=36881 RepID=A0AAE0GGN9_9CHLO|nr:hypothetical protein CYMTET_14338 [Cymbomonas tetramitiformis]|eukprot:gene5756-6949_t